MNKHLKALAIFGLGLGAANSADAQISYPYVVTFDQLTKNYNHTATNNLVSEGNVEWFMPGVYIGDPQVNNGDTVDFRYNQSLRSARMRLSTNSSGTPSYMEMKTDLPLGADSFSFWTGMYGTETGGKLLVSYSTNQGLNWTVLGDTINVTGTWATGQFVGMKPAISVPVRFKIDRLNTTNIRVNVDQIRVTAGAQATNINIIGKTPVGIVNPNTVNQLAFTFNEAVQLGSGNITLQEVGGAAQVFDVATATNVRASNDSVIVDGITIAPLKQYYVLVDSTVALGVNSNLNSVGIYGTNDWTFSTTDTILNRFTENFDNCENGPLGVFVQQSLVGTSTWMCNTYNDTANATYDAPYVSINGGSGAVSFANEDLLITSLPIKFNALAANHSRNATLSFYEKRRFGGNGVTRGVFYSTDYAGDAATATWVAINDNLPAIGQTGSFFPASVNINSAANTNQPFYIAFKYTSISDTDTAVNWEWALDRINVNYTDTDTSTTSTNKLSADNIFADVLGNATTENIDLRLSVRKDMEVAIRMYDINGRLVYNTVSAAKAGTQRIQLKNTTSNAGMYIIRLTTADGEKSIKTLVH